MPRPRIDEEKPPAIINTLVNMDGEVHKQHRQLVNDWFKPGEVRKLTERVEEQARRSVDEMQALGGECDFASDVAMNYPLRVILEILGLPEEEFPRMLRLTQELFGADDPDFERIGENEQMMAVIMDVIAYFTGLNAERREHPTDDLATVIANGQIDGTPLEDMDTYGYYLIVATAGHDTTSSAIAGGMQALLEHPDQLARLQADPSLIDGACDEIVRWVSPVKHFMRSAQQDYDARAAPRSPGATGCCSRTPSANRDERVFADPFTFDVDPRRRRQPPRLRLRPPLLPRRPPRPARDPGVLPRAAHPARLDRVGGPRRAHGVEPGERPEADAGDLQLQELSRLTTWDRARRRTCGAVPRPDLVRPARRRTGSGWPRTSR